METSPVMKQNTSTPQHASNAAALAATPTRPMRLSAAFSAKCPASNVAAATTAAANAMTRNANPTVATA